MWIFWMRQRICEVVTKIKLAFWILAKSMLEFCHWLLKIPQHWIYSRLYSILILDNNVLKNAVTNYLKYIAVVFFVKSSSPSIVIFRTKKFEWTGFFLPMQFLNAFYVCCILTNRVGSSGRNVVNLRCCQVTHGAWLQFDGQNRCEILGGVVYHHTCIIMIYWCWYSSSATLIPVNHLSNHLAFKSSEIRENIW